MKNTLYIFLISIVAFIVILSGSFFTIDQTKQAIVLQFGELAKVHQTPGLKFKIPFIQEVIFYEKRFLSYDLPNTPVTTVDQKRLEVDTYIRYRIDDPIRFFQTIKPASELGAQMRLEAIVNSTLRNVLGKMPLRNILSEERSKVMNQIQQEVMRLAKPMGLTIVDVRIIRTELPPENRNAVFARMNSELERIAKENRAKGAEIAQGIKSKADRDRTILFAEANFKSEKIRGEGEGQAIEIATSALAEDLTFYEFIQSLDIYQKTFDENTSLVMSFDHEFFKFLNNPEKVFMKTKIKE